MSLICMLWRHRITRTLLTQATLPNGAWLAQHESQCPQCATYRQELEQVQTHLARVLTTPELSSNFDAELWAKFQARRGERGGSAQGVLVWGTACGVAALLGWLWLVPHSQQSPTIPAKEARNDSGSPQIQVREPEIITHKPIQKKTVIARQPASAPKKLSLRTAVYREVRHYRLRDTTHKSHPQKPSAPRLHIANNLPDSKAKGLTWVQVGMRCEATGNYQAALDAYQRAYQAQPNSTLAYTVGRTAEMAGDSTQAMELYAQILQRSTPAPSPSLEKEKNDEKPNNESDNDHSALPRYRTGICPSRPRSQAYSFGGSSAPEHSSNSGRAGATPCGASNPCSGVEGRVLRSSRNAGYASSDTRAF